MPPIPGANRGRLGQGIPGGAASLPGSLPLPGGGQLGPPPGSLPSIPGVRRPIQASAPAPVLPPAIRTDPRAAQEVGSGLSSLRAAQDRRQNPGSTKNITVALGILDQVREGKLSPKKAAKLMQGLTAGDQDGLANLVSQRNSREGKVNMKELKALQELQKLPAPSDVQSHDILSNLARDTEGLITGLPAGIGLSAAYLGKDTVNTLRGKPSSNFLDKIVKPTAKTYKETYGPLVHGDVRGFYKQFHAHPLGPALDVASVLSAGAGIAGRVGRAGEALDRATAALGEKAAVTKAAPKFHVVGGPLELPHSAAEIRAEPWRSVVRGVINYKTGEAYWGSAKNIGAHETLWKHVVKNHPESEKDFVSVIGHLDPDTGEVGAVVPTLEGEGWERFGYSFTPSGDPMKPGTLHKPPGFEERVNEVGKASLERARADESPANIIPDSGRNSDRQGTLDEIANHLDNHGHTEFAQEIRDQKNLGGHEVQVSYPIVQGQFRGVEELDKSIEALAGEYGGQVVEAGSGMGGRDYSVQFPPGQSHREFMARLNRDLGLESHSFPVTEDGSPLLGVEHSGTRDEGGWLQSTDHPDSVEHLRDHLERNAPYEAGMQAALDKLNELESSKGPPPPDLPAGIPPPPEDLPKLTLGQKARVAVPAFLKAGGKGGLIDWYDERKGITHEAEIQDTMKQVASVLDDPDLRISRRTLGEVVKETAADIRATREAGRARPAEMSSKLPQFISPNSSGRVLSAGETALREASDMIRAGAIYLRPAYLPNNWAGNTFMNVVHQGVLAPVNLAKSLVLDKNIGVRYTRAMDKAMGANPATVVTSGKGRGYVASLTQPAAHIMGAAADQPFRRAAFLHEARRAGFSKLSEVKDLFDKAAGGDEASLRQIAEISRKGQEEIVKFGHMNDAERSLIRNMVFVYSWMRGAGRYAMRFPLQHPIQTNIFNAASGPGNQYTQSIMGGVPSFMSGVVPIGRGKDGNPIVINPFSLNPLGTGLQLLRAAAGTVDVLRNPKTFNKYAQTDVVDLLNPLLGAYVSAREGGPSMKKQIENTIAAMAFAKGLKHPGSGSIYPTSRSEAVGHFTLGSLYPREADQAAVTKSLEREQANNPIALIPQEIADFKKATGDEPPYDLVIAYRKDLEDLAQQKDFQAHYADSHGASGFRHMPPQNRLDAGIEFLKKYSKIDPGTIKEIETTSKELTTDEEYNEYANAVWHLTGVGQWKDAWDSMVRSVKNQSLTRKRP